MAANNELEEKPELSEKEKKKLEKAEKKKNKKATQVEEDEQEDTLANKLVIIFVSILIITIWLAIIGVIIKADVGGFGSSMLYPVLKDVPYVNKILPTPTYVDVDTEHMYSSLDEAIERIKELELQLDQLSSNDSADSKTIEELQAQIESLSKYKEEQAEFEKLKEKFYEEVVFSDNSPDIEEYKKYYEGIDPENAEILYKRVVEQMAYNQKITDYATTYSTMKPKEAAAIFDAMTDDLNLVADILMAMDVQSRANILGKMNTDNAAKVTEIMNPKK